MVTGFFNFFLRVIDLEHRNLRNLGIKFETLISPADPWRRREFKYFLACYFNGGQFQIIPKKGPFTRLFIIIKRAFFCLELNTCLKLFTPTILKIFTR